MELFSKIVITLQEGDFSQVIERNVGSDLVPQLSGEVQVGLMKCFRPLRVVLALGHKPKRMQDARFSPPVAQLPPQCPALFSPPLGLFQVTLILGEGASPS